MYPRHRLDSLTDGIFGVAMTLLVLDIRIPDGADAHTARELLSLLLALAPKVWPYALSFLVLGGRWRALTKGRSSHVDVSQHYVNWQLFYLLLVTLVPFSTMVLGRFASLAPSVWLYAANLAGMAFAAWRLAAALPPEERAQQEDSPVGLVIFLISGALAAAISLFNTPWANLAFTLNVLAPLAERMVRGRSLRREA